MTDDDLARDHFRYATPDEGRQVLSGYRGWAGEQRGIDLYLRGRFGDVTDITLPMDAARTLARWLLTQAGDVATDATIDP